MSTYTDNLLIDDLNNQIKLLEQLVNIKSISHDGTANDKVNAILAKPLAELGFKVKMVAHEHDRNPVGKCLIAEFQQRNKPYITLIGHSDTVNASDDFNGFHYEQSAKFAHGPGVIDCKGGLVVMISAVRGLISNSLPNNYSLRFISSPSEETGSREFHEHLVKYGTDSRYILGFEPAFANGNIVNARAGNRWYHIKIKGRSAHSGRNFEHGINAVAAMADKLCQLHQLSDIDIGTTVAITHISGGNNNYNTIPEFCEAYVDTRFLTADEDQRLQRAVRNVLRGIEESAYDDFKLAELHVDVVDYTQPIELHKSHNHSIDFYCDQIQRLEKRNIQACVSHGSADCNSLINDNNIFIGGLGAVGDGMHTVKEKIQINSLSTRAQAACQLISYIDKLESA